jgi:Flp pilus assembly protein TadD
MQTRRLHKLGNDTQTKRDDARGEDPLWVVDLGAGDLRLVQGDAALKELVRTHRLPRDARVYELSAASRTLSEIPGIDAAFEAQRASEAVNAAPAPAPPPEIEPAPPPAMAPPPAPIEPVAEHHERSVDHELKLLDRPFEDDTEYFEDPPRSRWLPLAGIAALLALFVGGGYVLFHTGRRAHPQSSPPETAPVAVTAPPSADLTNVAAPPKATSAPVERPLGDPPVAPSPAPKEMTVAPAPAPKAAAVAPSPAPQEAVVAPAPPSSSYSDRVAEGKRLFEKGHGRKAEALFEEALSEKPDGIEALVGLAYAQLDRGKMSEAVSSFKRAVDQDHDYAPAVFGLAEGYRQQGNRRAALATFKKFLTLEHSGGDADIARRLIDELSAGG